MHRVDDEDAVVNVERFFDLVREWHQCVEAYTLLLRNEYAVALLSASNLAPCKVTALATSSTTHGTTSTQRNDSSGSAPQIELLARCCRLRTTLDETERCALSVVPSSLDDSDTVPWPFTQAAQDSGAAGRRCIHALLMRAHRQGCACQGRASTRAILFLDSLDPSHSLVVAAHCGAVRAYMRSNAGSALSTSNAVTSVTCSSATNSSEQRDKGRMRWLLPQQLAPRVLHDDATANYDRICNGRSDSGGSAAASPLHLRYVGGNTSERILQLLFQPKRDRANTTPTQLHSPSREGDGCVGATRPGRPVETPDLSDGEPAGFESMVLYNICLLWRLFGYDVVDREGERTSLTPRIADVTAPVRTESSDVDEAPTRAVSHKGPCKTPNNATCPLWSQLRWRLRCRYCAATPFVTEEAAARDNSQPSAGVTAHDTSHAVQSDAGGTSEAEGHVDGKIYTVICAAAAGTTMGHTDRCPWRRLFLDRVIQSSSSLRRFVDFDYHLVSNTTAGCAGDEVTDVEAASGDGEDEATETLSSRAVSDTGVADSATPEQRAASTPRTSSSASCKAEESTDVVRYDNTVRVRFILSEVQQLVTTLRASQELEQRKIFHVAIDDLLHRADAIVSAVYKDSDVLASEGVDAMNDCSSDGNAKMSPDGLCSSVLFLPTDACSLSDEAVIVTSNAQTKDSERDLTHTTDVSVTAKADMRISLLREGLALLQETLSPTVMQTSTLYEKCADFARQHRTHFDATAQRQTQEDLVARRLCVDLLPWAVGQTATRAVTISDSAATSAPQTNDIPAAQSSEGQDSSMPANVPKDANSAHQQALTILQRIEDVARQECVQRRDRPVEDTVNTTSKRSLATNSSDSQKEWRREGSAPQLGGIVQAGVEAKHAAASNASTTPRAEESSTRVAWSGTAGHSSLTRPANKRHQPHQQQTWQSRPVLPKSSFDSGFRSARATKPASAPLVQRTQPMQQPMHETQRLPQSHQLLYNADAYVDGNAQRTHIPWPAPANAQAHARDVLTSHQSSFAATQMAGILLHPAPASAPPVFTDRMTNDTYTTAPPVLGPGDIRANDAQRQGQTYSTAYFAAMGDRGILPTPFETKPQGANIIAGPNSRTSGSVLGDTYTTDATRGSIFPMPPNALAASSPAVFADVESADTQWAERKRAHLRTQ